MEDDRDNFIDLDDSSNEIVDDDVQELGEDSRVRGDAESSEDEGEEEQEDEYEAGVDLNDLSDEEPERDDAKVTFFDVPRVASQAASEAEEERPKPLHAVAAHPTNPEMFATAGESDEIYLCHVSCDSEGKVGASTIPMTTLQGHTDTIVLLQFSPDGGLLATAAMDCTVRIWSVESGECIHVLNDLCGEVESLLWHPSGLAIVAGGTDAQAIMWNVKKGAAAMYFGGHRDAVTVLNWAYDCKKIVTGSRDGTVMMYAAKTGEVEMSIQKGLSPDMAAITCMTMIPDLKNATADGFVKSDGDLVVVGAEDGTLHVLSLPAKRVLQTLDEIHEQSIESVAISGNPLANPYFATCGCDCRVVVWDMMTFVIRSSIYIGEAAICMKWNNHTLMVGCSDAIIRVYDGRASLEQQAETGMAAVRDVEDDDALKEKRATYRAPAVLLGHRRLLTDMALNANGTCLFTSSDDGSSRVFSTMGLAQNHE